MKYPQTVKTLAERICQSYPAAQNQLKKSSTDDFKKGIFKPHFLPAYLLWMLQELEMFDDREKAASWLGWVNAKLDGIPVLNIITLQEIRDLVRGDKERQPVKQTDEYPKFLMEIGGERRYLAAKQAGIAYDSGWVSVKICGDVLERDGLIRPIKEEERRLIAEIAEEWSASK